MGPAVIGGLALNYFQQQQAARDRRKQARASILQQSAASLKAPTYNVQAARVNDQNQTAMRNMGNQAASGALMGYLQGLERPERQELDPLAQDYQNNPMAYPPAGGMGR